MKKSSNFENYDFDQQIVELLAADDHGAETTSASRVISNQFEKVLDSLPFYVMLVDASHHIHFANKAIRATLGLTLEEVTGQHCPRLVHGTEETYPGCPVQDVIDGKGVTEKEYYAAEVNRWILTTAYPTGIKTSDGLDVFYHTIKDITGRKEAEKAVAESERKYHRLFEEIREVVFIMSPDGDLVDINSAGRHLFGLHHPETINEFNLYRDLNPISGGWAAFRNALKRDGYVKDYELSIMRRNGGLKGNGDIKFLSISCSAEKDNDGNILVIRGIISDKTHEKLHNEVRERVGILESATQRFSALTRQAIIDKHWEVAFEDDYIPTCWEMKNCTSKECPVYGKEHLRCWLIAGTFCRGEVQGQFARKLDDCGKCEVYKAALAHNPVSEIVENFNNLMWSLREKEDQLKVVNQELENQYQELDVLHREAEERATIDSLTGLKNHGHFQHHLHKEIIRAARYKRDLSLVMIDLDKFKTVNDKFGHQKGDKVLSQVGKLLAQEIRVGDYIARYGGEEFVVVMPEITGAEAVKFAERLRFKFEQLYKIVGLPEGQTSASFGVADFPACAADNKGLIAAADAVLLLAKRQGRNRVLYCKDFSKAELYLAH